MTTNRTSAEGAPAWMITYADMITLLLTFFVMLAAMSEMKSEENYQQLMDSIQQQFGRSEAQGALSGRLRPRHAELARLAASYLAAREAVAQPPRRPESQQPLLPPVPASSSDPANRPKTVLYFPDETPRQALQPSDRGPAATVTD